MPRSPIRGSGHTGATTNKGKLPGGARDTIAGQLIKTVHDRLVAGQPVRRTLPGHGRLHIDRQLPFLCVYRRPRNREDQGTDRMIVGEGSYLIAPAAPRHHPQLAALVRSVVEVLSREFGAVLLLEVWAGPEDTPSSDPTVPDVAPNFEVFAGPTTKLDGTVEALAGGLRSIEVMGGTGEVDVIRQSRTFPTGRKPLISDDDAARMNVFSVGIEVPPVYRSTLRNEEFPLVLRRFRRQFAIALRRTFFQFARSRTTQRPPHFHELGPRAVVKAVWAVDRQLYEVANTFEFLRIVTPLDTGRAWLEFKRCKFERQPDFHYRPLPFDPVRLKRRLFAVPVERIEDPALHNVFIEKIEELDRQISMLRDRNTERFRYGSLELFGRVGETLRTVALDLLERVPRRTRALGSALTDAAGFAGRARDEIDWYRERDPDFSPEVRVTDGVAGMMVSQGELLIAPDMTFSDRRVDALIQHEVGTHLLTWHNGGKQPFRQLQIGLTGYDELQEGLAVLAEYLVGGLSGQRLRQLAGRVIAVHSMLDDASFVETFRLLNRTYGFSQRPAYTITMRVYRGGGLTKDAVYLRGLRAIIEYVRGGGELEPLFLGKMAANHIPLIRELRFRKVLREPSLRPRYMESPEVAERLADLRSGSIHLSDLISEP